MKKILPIILFFICILSGGAFAADISIENAVVDRDTQVFSLSGTVTPDASANEIIIMLLKPGKSATALDAVTDITDFNNTVEYFRQIPLATDGSFGVSAYINNQSQTVDNLPDEYTLVISRADFDAPYEHSEKVAFYTAPEVAAAKIAVNTAAQNAAADTTKKADLITALNNNAGVLGIDLSHIGGISVEGMQEDELFIAESVTAKYTELGTFTLAKEVRDIVTESSALYDFNNADTTGRISLLETRAADFGIATLPAMTVYNSLSNDGKTRVAANMNNAFTIEVFKTSFVSETVLSAVQYLPSHSLLRDAFDKCQSALTGSVDISTYLSLTDTSSVDKEMINKNFATVGALATHINPLITAAANPAPPAGDDEDVIIDDGGGSSGGGGGGGSPSIKFETPKVEETPIVVQPEKQEIFADLAESEWAKEAIEALYEKEIISGKSDGVFDPGGSVKREEFAKMIVLTFDIGAGAAAEFSDVAEGDWYQPYVAAAEQNGIIGGMGDGTFGAGRSITRQDMAVMIYRAAEKRGIIEAADNDLTFTDAAQIAPYAADAVASLCAAGVINGTPDGAFMPGSGATRAEAAKMIYEIVKMLDNAEGEVRG